ncbi:hypothetical protein ACFW6S_36065 [Streptomyces sp. NPDC058740]|uniref:hypothetical protein n=1 Tax=Streptomyces sp. NPDC058740 TaxID=3346619 RepID=UPI00367EDD91
MHKRRALAALTLLLAASSTACSSGPAYDESVKECHKVLVSRPADETGKPKECEPLKEEDFTALAGSAAIERLGWTDKNGNFDESKMLQDTDDD